MQNSHLDVKSYQLTFALINDRANTQLTLLCLSARATRLQRDCHVEFFRRSCDAQANSRAVERRTCRVGAESLGTGPQLGHGLYLGGPMSPSALRSASARAWRAAARAARDRLGPFQFRGFVEHCMERRTVWHWWAWLANRAETPRRGRSWAESHSDANRSALFLKRLARRARGAAVNVIGAPKTSVWHL